jgi:hypothetical protein
LLPLLITGELTLDITLYLGGLAAIKLAIKKRLR